MTKNVSASKPYSIIGSGAVMTALTSALLSSIGLEQEKRNERMTNAILGQLFINKNQELEYSTSNL